MRRGIISLGMAFLIALTSVCSIAAQEAVILEESAPAECLHPEETGVEAEAPSAGDSRIELEIVDVELAAADDGEGEQPVQTEAESPAPEELTGAEENLSDVQAEPESYVAGGQTEAEVFVSDGQTVPENLVPGGQTAPETLVQGDRTESENSAPDSQTGQGDDSQGLSSEDGSGEAATAFGTDEAAARFDVAQEDGCEEAYFEVLPEAVVDGTWILAAEEVENPQDAALYEAELSGEAEGGSGTLVHSGRAADACLPRMRLMSGRSTGCYEGSYGAQLTGNAKSIYEMMKIRVLKNQSMSPFALSLDDPYTFTVYPSYKDGSPVDWNLDGNETYQNEIKQEITRCAQAAYDAFSYDYPEAFWLGTFRYHWSVTTSKPKASMTGTGTVNRITFTPTEEYDNAYNDRSDFAAVRSGLTQRMKNTLSTGGSGTVLDKVTLVHNYLCRVLTYSDSNAYAWSAGGAFLYSDVVCEGYAKAFKILCNDLGVECVLVPGLATTGKAGAEPSEAHMWNYVKMDDGCWYLVDVTWDDQETRGTLTSYFLKGSLGYGFFDPASGTANPMTIGQERIIYTNFSTSEHSVDFCLPELTGADYAPGQAEQHAHTWQAVSRTEPTCEKDGKAVYQCTSCLAEKQECLTHTGHKFGTYVPDGNVSCKKDGTKTAVCERCGVKTDSIPDPGGHVFRYVDNKNATALKDGTLTGICTRCGTKRTVTNRGTKLKATIALNVTSLKLRVGQTTTKVKVSKLAKGDGVARWKSSKPSVVTVKTNAGKTGKLTAKKKGTATVMVVLKSGLKKTFRVTVQTGKVKTSSITGLDKKLTLKVGKKKALKPVLKPVTSQEKVTYASSNKKVAEVSAKGVIRAKKAGTAKITVRSGKKKAVVVVKVQKK